MAAKAKRGRPPLPSGEGSRVHLHVRVRQSEKDEIDAVADRCGIGASEIIRAGALKEARRLAKRQG